MVSDVNKKNADWYKENKEILSSLYQNQYLVIKNRCVLESFDTCEDAEKAARLLSLDKDEHLIEFTGPASECSSLKFVGA